jgi:hypothetical protein
LSPSRRWRRSGDGGIPAMAAWVTEWGGVGRGRGGLPGGIRWAWPIWPFGRDPCATGDGSVTNQATYQDSGWRRNSFLFLK